MKLFKSLTVAALAIPLALTGCVTDPVSGQRNTSKTAMYGLGGAAVCGIVGALTHGGKGARNSALACGAIGAGVGGYMDYQEKKLRENLKNTNIEVERQGNQIKLVMPENVTFATGSAALSDQARNALATASETLVQYPDTTLTINGHTDNHRQRRHQRTAVAQPCACRCRLPAIARRERLAPDHRRLRLTPSYRV